MTTRAERIGMRTFNDGRFLETELKLLGDSDGLTLNARIPIRSALVVIGNYSSHLQNRLAVRYCPSDSLAHQEQAVEFRTIENNIAPYMQ